MEIFSCKSSVEQLSGYFLKPKNKDACIVYMYTPCIRQHLHTVNHHFMLKDIIHKKKSLSIYTLINCCIYMYMYCVHVHRGAYVMFVSQNKDLNWSTMTAPPLRSATKLPPVSVALGTVTVLVSLMYTFSIGISSTVAAT